MYYDIPLLYLLKAKDCTLFICTMNTLCLTYSKKPVSACVMSGSLNEKVPILLHVKLVKVPNGYKYYLIVLIRSLFI